MHFLVINKSRYNLVLMTRFLNNLQKIVSWTGIEMRGSFSNYGTSCAIKSMKLYFGFFKVLLQFNNRVYLVPYSIKYCFYLYAFLSQCVVQLVRSWTYDWPLTMFLRRVPVNSNLPCAWTPLSILQIPFQWLEWTWHRLDSTGKSKPWSLKRH